MNSGGSSSGKAPVQPQPQGSQTTPYGNATPFNPMFTSYLPPEGSMASAQLGDVPRQETGPPTPLLQQQQSSAAEPELGSAAGIRALLAKAMMRQEASRRDALDGGFFNGTNAQRQAHLRANRKYPGAQA